MDEYASIDYGKDYLAHHGVKGMKWGVRKTIERMGVSRKLKKNEKQYVKNQQLMLNAIKTRNNLRRQGGSQRRLMQNEIRAKQVDKYISNIGKNIKANRNESKQIIKDARKKGYSVSSVSTRTGVKNTAIRGAKVGAATRGTLYGLSGAAFSTLALSSLATVPITTPAAAIIIGSYAVGAAAGGAARGGLIGGAMGAAYGAASVSAQRKRGYLYADKVFNKNNDVPASILYKKYSVSDIKHVDDLYSDYLAHYGVKGMKWGVRKAIQTTGRVARKTGKALVGAARLIGKTSYGAGVKIRRFKNGRAIKSANPERIARRANKMTNEELSSALARLQMKNQISNYSNNRQTTNTRTLGSIVADSMKQKVANMSANALQTSVDSLLRGENPITGMVRNAKAQKALQEQQISDNRLKTTTNLYKLANAGLQNRMNISAMNQQIAANNYKTVDVNKSLLNILSDSVKSAPITSINRTPSYSSGKDSVKIVLYNNATMPIPNLDRATRRQSTGVYMPRHIKHDDFDDFIAHHGVLGMKWGIRKDDLNDVTVDADDIYRRRESSNKAPTNDIEDRGYTYVYDPSNSRDEDFYTQFGNRVIDKAFGEEGKIAGYTSAGKAFADHIFDGDYRELKSTDVAFKSAQRDNGEDFVMSLLSAPYDPNKSPKENESNYNNRLVEYGARTLGSGMGAHRHPWIDEEHNEDGDGLWDGDTARNDAARRVADILKDEGYIGMRDFKDISGHAGIETATILFNDKHKMYDETYGKRFRHDDMSLIDKAR